MIWVSSVTKGVGVCVERYGHGDLFVISLHRDVFERCLHSDVFDKCFYSDVFVAMRRRASRIPASSFSS